jgi:hypothetical protein
MEQESTLMKTLIAVLTCARYLERRNACRDTWVSWVSKLNPDADVLFFTGRESCVDDSCGDIVRLDCPDDYRQLPQKTIKLIEYAASHDYDLLVKTDDDTYLLPLPGHIAEFAKHECVGSVRPRPQHNEFIAYAQGGCYSLNRRAIDAVLKHRDLFTSGLEDGTVGKALSLEGIKPTHSDRIKTDYRHDAPCLSNDIISAHGCTPEMLNTIHQRNILPLLSVYNAILPTPKEELSNVRQPSMSVFDVVPVPSDGITVAITSCNRHDLLRRTMESLAASCIDAPIHETIIIEDSNARKPEWLLEFRGLGNIRWISNGKRVGQWMSADRLMDAVKTEYVFWCEDDWEFDGRPFMSASLNILKEWSNAIQVSLRGNDNTSGHPNTYGEGMPFAWQQPYWREVWGGFSGNPGLRRKSDWQRIGSYGRVTGYGQGGIAPEQTLSKLYLDLGYRIAVLPTDTPFVKHIGERRSKAIDKLEPRKKVLIAIPACWHYAYGAHKLNGIERQTDGRVEAVRSTWAKDVAVFSDYVDLKFFYGRSPNSKMTPRPDEVFLNVLDDYDHLPHKMQAIYRWAFEHKYDYVFKCDDDTFVKIDRLMRTDYENHDQMGFFRCRCKDQSRCQDYITGGCGYFLSRRALQLLVNAPLTHWAEDFNTGKILRSHRLKPVGHPGFIPGFDKHFVDIGDLPETFITAHAVTPEGMRTLYAR